MTKVLVVGKYRSIVHWVENTVTAFAHQGCEVRHFAVNGGSVWQSLHYKVSEQWHGNSTTAMCSDLQQTLTRYQPDLVVFIVIAALHMPACMFAAVRALCPAAYSVAWIGDKLTRADSHFAQQIDWVFATDTGFIELLRQYDFRVPASYLPLAVDTRMFHPFNHPRSNRIIYVANNSPERGKMVLRMHHPISLYGKGWSAFNNTPHDTHARRLPYRQLPRLYAGCRAVLNIHNEKNVIHGLNQRSFEPYGCMTPVLHDDMVDISRCFEPNKEILIWRTLEELHAWVERLQQDPAFARSIGLAGHHRVLAEHTYQHRVKAILSTCSLK